MEQNIPPIEEVDPEFGGYLMDVANHRNGFEMVEVYNDRVFVVSSHNKKVPIQHRIVKEINLEIGRNDKCICGSGKKYKKCCLKK